MDKKLSEIIMMIVAFFVLLLTIESIYVTYSDPYVLEEYYVSGTINYISLYNDPDCSSNSIISFTILKDDGSFKTFLKNYTKKYDILDEAQYDILHCIYDGQDCTLKIQKAIKRTLFLKIQLDDPVEYITNLF